MRKAIPLSYYIAFNNPKAAQELIVKYTMKPARNPKELAKKLDYLLAHNKEEFLKELANIHPDKEMVLHYMGASEAEGKSNACGCNHGVDGNSTECPHCKSSANGKKPDAAEQMKKIWEGVKPYTPVIIGGALLLTGLIVVVKRA